jgi:putative endonuclease
MSSIHKGIASEKLVAQYLQQQGMNILQRNFRCKLGEIDLICKDSSQLVFIEVRYRKSLVFGGPMESITYRKQQKIIHTAQFFLQINPWADKLSCRFDVLGISSKIAANNIEWIKDAFQDE